MIEIEYTTNAQETATATLDFMTNRPILALLFKFMQFSCALLCLLFMFALYYKMLRWQDVVIVAAAAIWLLAYKKINRWIISSGLKRRKHDTYKCIYKIDEKSILYQLHHYSPRNIEWKKLKFVLKNQDGYIIPLTGLTNAGRFLWLPLRSLQAQDEQTFLSLLEKFKLKLIHANT